MPRVSVVVPARNAAATISRCLDALGQQNLADPYEVIVVDNGSVDGTAELAERASPPVKVLLQDNLGPAAARNRAAREAGSELLAFTDADCYPEPGWLAAGVHALERAELVQGQVLPDPAATLHPFSRSLWVTSDDGLYQTANLFVHRRAFERAGGFEALYSPGADRPFGEDVWFGWRVRRSGARVVFAPEALVRHAVFPGDAGTLIAERRRDGLFVDLVRRIPELRRTLLFGRCFLSRRSAAFDAAVAACMLAALTRSRLPLAGAGPYAAMVTRRRPLWRPTSTRVAGVELAADAAGLASLVAASVRRRTLVL